MTFLKLPTGTTEQEMFDKLEEMGAAIENMATAASGLAIETGEPEALAAAPDPAKYVPIEVVSDLMKGWGEDRASQSAERAEVKVTEALAQG